MKKFLLFLFVVAPLWAGVDAGDLDTSFGNGGIVITKFGSFSFAYGAAIQANGKIILCGHTADGPNGFDFSLIRYNRDGSVDTSFGNNGFLFIDFGGNSEALAVAIQADGKIVACGVVNGGVNAGSIALARFNLDGMLDTSFGPDGTGFLATNLGDFSNFVALVIQSDGKLVAGGFTFAGPHLFNFVFARYNSDGLLDTSFGPDGTGFFYTDFGDRSQAQALAIQKDGKIVAGGSTFAGPNTTNFALARYNSDGLLDTSFGPDGTGFFYTDFEVNSSVFGLAVQVDGKIVASGNADNNFAVARYNSDGLPDDSFGQQGKMVYISGSTGFNTKIALQADGKMVLADDLDSPDGLGLLRLNNNGKIDTSFGNNGFVLTAVSTSDERALAILTQADGKIVVIGATGDDTLTARYLSGVETSDSAQAIFAKYSLFPQYINRQSPNSI